MMPKSNKARGKVLINDENNPGTKNFGNLNAKPINQARGPQTGNAGNATKQRTFLEEKSDRNSRFQNLANMITAAFTRRGDGMKPHTEASTENAAPNVNVGRRRGK